MRKEYKDQDIEQMINSRLFLKKIQEQIKKKTIRYVFTVDSSEAFRLN